MAVVKLTGGVVLDVAARVDDVSRLVNAAKHERVMLLINAPDGRKILINPDHIVYVDDEPGED